MPAIVAALQFVRLVAASSDLDREGDYVAHGAEYTYRIRRDGFGWTLRVEHGAISVDATDFGRKGDAELVARAHETIADQLNDRGRDHAGRDRMDAAYIAAVDLGLL